MKTASDIFTYAITTCVVFSIAVFVFSPLYFGAEEVFADDATASVTVGNASSTASSVTINGGEAITLTENATSTVAVTGTVTDSNGCGDLTSVKVAIYKQGTTCTASGNADNDNCYFYEDSNPSAHASCSGEDDTTYAVSYNFSVYYYADGGTWLATITPADEEAGVPDNSTTVTLNDLQSINVSETISFGSVAAGAASTGDHTATLTNTGNVAVDSKVHGTALTCTVRSSVPVGNQEWALASFTYGDGTDLTDSAAPVGGIDASLAAPGNDTVPVTDATYWQVSVPNGAEGTCTGTTTFTAMAAS